MSESTTIEPTLLVACQWEEGYTWTLPSRLGNMVKLAMEMFGPRDKSYTILGIEFVADGPRLWYPGNRKDIIIQLDFSAAQDMHQACYQLAHETIHLLSPSGGQNANNFEEGLATYFSHYYMRTQFNQPNWRSPVPSYQRAVNLISPHLNSVPNAIRRMRESQPAISSITADELCLEFPELTSDGAQFLVQRFQRVAP